jgi:hypothetical protein
LVERGEYGSAATVLVGLLASDVSDIDKAMMCLNLAVIADKTGETDEALAWYDRGVDLEQPHGRFFVAEQRAVYLSEKERDHESLVRYRELLERPGLTEDDAERIRSNIEVLKRRIG